MLSVFLNSKFFFKIDQKYQLLKVYKFHKENRDSNFFWLKSKLGKYNVKPSSNKGQLLIQIQDDYRLLIKSAVFSKVYCEKHNLNQVLFDPLWTKKIGWYDKQLEFYFKFFKNPLYSLFLSFGNKILFKGHDLYFDQKLIKNEYNRIVQNLNSAEDVLAVKVEDILIGDLIYDTFNRYFSVPTVTDCKDQRLLDVIEITLNIYYIYKKILKDENIKCVVLNNTAYNHNGIVTRLSLANNIDVYTLGLHSYFYNKVEKEYPYHYLNFNKFTLDKKIDAIKIEKCKQLFEMRYKGITDNAIAYMKNNPFVSKSSDDILENLFVKDKRNVVIYPHDFYDAAHLFGDLFFNDFYSYLFNLLYAIKDDNQTIYWVKNHPNGLSDCKERTKEMILSMNSSNICLLDDSISNSDIIKLKPDLIVTASGTVALEMSYIGLKVVSLKENFYKNFNFTYCCDNLVDYYKVVKGEIEFSITNPKEKVLSFYYQCYIENTELFGEKFFEQINELAYIDDTQARYQKIINNKDLFFDEKFNQLIKV